MLAFTKILIRNLEVQEGIQEVRKATVFSSSHLPTRLHKLLVSVIHSCLLLDDFFEQALLKNMHITFTWPCKVLNNFLTKSSMFSVHKQTHFSAKHVCVHSLLAMVAVGDSSLLWHLSPPVTKMSHILLTIGVCSQHVRSLCAVTAAVNCSFNCNSRGRTLAEIEQLR